MIQLCESRPALATSRKWCFWFRSRVSPTPTSSRAKRAAKNSPKSIRRWNEEKSAEWLIAVWYLQWRALKVSRFQLRWLIDVTIIVLNKQDTYRLISISSCAMMHSKYFLDFHVNAGNVSVSVREFLGWIELLFEVSVIVCLSIKSWIKLLRPLEVGQGFRQIVNMDFQSMIDDIIKVFACEVPVLRFSTNRHWSFHERFRSLSSSNLLKIPFTLWFSVTCRLSTLQDDWGSVMSTISTEVY